MILGGGGGGGGGGGWAVVLVQELTDLLVRSFIRYPSIPVCLLSVVATACLSVMVVLVLETGGGNGCFLFRFIYLFKVHRYDYVDCWPVHHTVLLDRLRCGDMWRVGEAMEHPARLMADPISSHLIPRLVPWPDTACG